MYNSMILLMYNACAFEISSISNILDIISRYNRNMITVKQVDAVSYNYTIKQWDQ